VLGVERTWIGVEPRLFLSNAPIAHPCPSRPTEVSFDCWKPLDRLPANGVLVAFTSPRGVILPEWSGDVRQSQAALWCEELGGERQLSTVFPMAGITACLRGPDFAVNDSAFRKLVSSYTQLSEPSPFPRSPSPPPE
jgi:hypothetical protein